MLTHLERCGRFADYPLNAASFLALFALNFVFLWQGSRCDGWGVALGLILLLVLANSLRTGST